MNRLPVASAHGRFQPLHLGHMEYLSAAKENCEFLYIGITQYNIRSLSDNPITPHRTRPEDNPLTFFERVQLITDALVDVGINRNDFCIVPFPIENAQQLPDFIPISIPVFTTVYDDWNRHKVKVLSDVGYNVITLWERDNKQYRGSIVRKGIMADDKEWTKMVPPATIRAVQSFGVRDRLAFLNECGQVQHL